MTFPSILMFGFSFGEVQGIKKDPKIVYYLIPSFLPVSTLKDVSNEMV